VGDFFNLTYDKQATIDKGVANWSEFAYGTFCGQLARLKRGQAEFHMAAGDGELWKTVLDMQTGVEKDSGVIVTDIQKINPGSMEFAESRVKAIARAELQDLVDQRIKTPAQVIEIGLSKSGGETIKVKERTHNQFGKLLYLLSKGEHVYLWGPPGTGKSHAAWQAARLLKRTYGFLALNSQTPDSRLFGFINAVSGKYVPTEFHNCYKVGKSIFCLDEADNAPGGLLTTLNGMHAAPRGAFPCGTVPMGKDYALVATGNTCGRGADDLFPDRWSFDQAFADRFSFLYWGYDEDMEHALATEINPAAEAWVEWIFKIRIYCAENYPKLFATPRASYRGAKFLKDAVLSIEEIAECVLFKGFDRDSKSAILREHPLPAVIMSKKNGNGGVQ
jgi:cobaltochelatase CobS